MLRMKGLARIRRLWHPILSPPTIVFQGFAGVYLDQRRRSFIPSCANSSVEESLLSPNFSHMSPTGDQRSTRSGEARDSVLAQSGIAMNTIFALTTQSSAQTA